uniref:PH domain-containing protein n=1 Tax=Ditylenchus dipsaci TaxID=166011 RepID=A0A915DPT9_9BILA
MRLAAVEVEEKSSDKRAFNLLYKSDLRLFELAAATATERKTWHRLIENQVAVTRQEMPDASSLFDTLSTSPSNATFNSPYKVARSTIVGQEDEPGNRQGVGLAKIEQVHVMTHPSLVNAAEITVQQPKILEHAQPIVTQADRLTRNDKMIVNALVDKHNILAELLKQQNKGNPEELERISEMMTGLSVAELKQRSSKELAMSAIVHGNRLLDSINKGKFGYECKERRDKLVLDESEKHLPSVPCYKLTAVAAPLMNHLKALMQVIQDQEMEIASLKQEVVRARDSNGPGEEQPARKHF